MQTKVRKVYQKNDNLYQKIEKKLLFKYNTLTLT